MQFVFAYQREPHAGQLAFADVQQPQDLGERATLAHRTCTDLALAPADVWIDGMDDQSRALFGDLPSPAIIIDPLGSVRVKLPWAEPEALAPTLKQLLAALPDEIARELARAPASDAVATTRRLGAQLWTFAHRTGANCPSGSGCSQATPGCNLHPPLRWIDLVTGATQVVENPTDVRCAEWLTLLATTGQPVVQQWALSRLLDLHRRAKDQAAATATEAQLAELRHRLPWLEGFAP